MGGGGSAPDSSSTTQQIGNDALSQGLAGVGINFIRPGQGNSEQQLEQQGLQNLQGAGAAGGLTQAGTDQLLSTIRGDGAAALPGQLEAITNPSIRRLQRATLPSISGEFAQSAGRGSGNEFAATADAQAGVAAEIAAQGAALQNQERDRQFGAAQFFPQAQQGAINVGNAQLGGSNNSLSRNAQLAALLPALRTTTTTGAGQQAGPGKGQGIGQLAGTAIGAYFGGPAGAAAGGAAGGELGSAIG